MDQRATTPIDANRRKQTMLDFVEFGRAGRIMADGDGQWGLIRKFLQFALEKPQTGSLATTAVGGDQAFRRIRIGFLTHMEPPLPKAFHGQGSDIVVRAHVDPSRVAHGIIHAIGDGLGHLGSGKSWPFTSTGGFTG